MYVIEMRNIMIFLIVLLFVLIYGCASKYNNPYKNHPILIKEKQFCPKFENCEFRENEILLDTCQVELNDWKLHVSVTQFETGKYKIFGAGSFASQIPIMEPHPFVRCQKGVLAGQNINNYYCRIDIQKKPIVDENGTILSSSLIKTISAEYDVSSKKLIKQSCFNFETIV